MSSLRAVFCLTQRLGQTAVSLSAVRRTTSGEYQILGFDALPVGGTFRTSQFPSLHECGRTGLLDLSRRRFRDLLGRVFPFRNHLPLGDKALRIDRDRNEHHEMTVRHEVGWSVAVS